MYSDEQKAAFINAQTLMCRLEMEGMLAENHFAASIGNTIPYTEDAFIVLRERFEPVLGINAITAFFRR